jgi:very-short-patch-repair endonuclease
MLSLYDNYVVPPRIKICKSPRPWRARDRERGMNGMHISFAKDLRKRSTDAERLLWRHLRAKRICGLKFRRQQCIGDYIVDFVCFEKRIVIELDGGQHADNREKDKVRDSWL